MIKPSAIIGQVILYGAFAVFIGYFATSPKYHQIPEDVALIKLSISHLGDRECRKRTPEELEKLPRNMRAPLDCPRERSDITLQVDLDGQTVFDTVMHPTGIAKDGVATVYKRFEVKAGEHMLSVRMNDNLAKPGFKFVKEDKVNLKPAQVLVIDFNPDKGGLFFQ
ncbi:MAG: hypothetical protein HY778_16755 [Betaproteobacteria bacterium]|nr:hypothetical protein [Betaproteobacteria bacterium]